MAGKLSTLAIARLSRPGNHADGGNLYLRIQPEGSKSWVFRFKRRNPVTGKDKTTWVGLGSLELVSLAEARARALEYRKLLRNGGDPLAAERARRAGHAGGRPFFEVMAAYLEAHRAGWRSEKHAREWQTTLEQHAARLLPISVTAIDTGAVLAVVRPIWNEKTETASRLRGRIENVLDYATARGWRVGENPARWRGHLDKLLPPRSKVAAVTHHAAVPWQDIGRVMARLAESQGTAARCLQFLILTAARSGEARGARWNEIDLDAALWTVPAERMKAGRDHRVPLSEPALAILREMMPLKRRPDGLVFPGGKPGSPLSDVALSKALAVAGGGDATVHGMRSTFRDWCAEATAYPREVAESALAHANRDRVE
ncbi:MAG: integrase arm-type DNA-binding domain-containing protein, partial [Acidibrevibacterium sp.]|uniref:tyrosine-type recombinase/integrase n=1 Tax=Acidibrevibacterium fodinaquatile TaxID=1969806 RepID=UPI0023A7EEFF